LLTFKIFCSHSYVPTTSTFFFQYSLPDRGFYVSPTFLCYFWFPRSLGVRS
jgi:hypothetical protein